MPRGCLGTVCDTWYLLVLPPAGARLVPLSGLAPQLKDYLHDFHKRMLRDDLEQVNKDLQAAKTYRDLVWQKKSDRLHLAERMWEAGLLGTCPEAIDYGLSM